MYIITFKNQQLIAFVAMVIFALLTQAVGASTQEPNAVTKADRPNIVLIVADDIAPHLCNFMPDGKGNSLTPNLDALAEGGVVLNNIHSPSPICTPSRFTLLTGKYASRATNASFIKETHKHDGQTAVAFNTHIEEGDDNLAKRLKAAGYTTGIVGKNHVVEAPGYERLDYFSKANDTKVQATLKSNAKHVKQAFYDAGFDYAQALYHGNPDADGIRELAVQNQEWITDAALKFIKQQGEDQEKPFFLYMATTVPHGPHEAKRSWNSNPLITPEGLLDEAPNVQPARDTIPSRLKEAGVHGWNRENVLWLDDAVGAVVDELQKQGIKKNTVIIFLSDHGTEAKGSVYQRGTRTVGLMWRDGGFEIEPLANQAFMLPDIAPTILSWADADYNESDFDGRDMQPVLNGEQESIHDSLYFELGFTRAVQKNGLKYIAVRYPQWAEDMTTDERQKLLDKLIKDLERRGRPVPTRDPATPFSHLTIVPGGADAEQVSIKKHPSFFDSDQLYDINKDPDEQRNLISDPAYAEHIAELKTLLEKKVDSLPGHFAEFGQTAATAKH